MPNIRSGLRMVVIAVPLLLSGSAFARKDETPRRAEPVREHSREAGEHPRRDSADHEAGARHEDGRTDHAGHAVGAVPPPPDEDGICVKPGCRHHP
jgi:hypothetical protein